MLPPSLKNIYGGILVFCDYDPTFCELFNSFLMARYYLCITGKKTEELQGATSCIMPKKKYFGGIKR